MGFDERIHRGCDRKAGLRLENCGPDLRHVSRKRNYAAGRSGIHAGGAFHASTTLQTRFSERKYLHGLGLSAKGLREMGRVRVRIRKAFAGKIWRARGE